jgi:hypothetical protein
VTPSASNPQDTDDAPLIAPVFLSTQRSEAALQRVMSYLEEGHYLAANHTSSLRARMLMHSPDAHAAALLDLSFVWSPAGGITMQGQTPHAFPVPSALAPAMVLVLLLVVCAGITAANTVAAWRMQGCLHAEVKQYMEGRFVSS